MRNAKARQQLEDLLAQLREWETSVPRRAQNFHSARHTLEAEVRKSLTFWSLLFIGDEVVERHRDRVERLETIAAPLAELIRKAEVLETDVARLALDVRIEDDGLAQWLAGRCREWEVTLGRLGTSCDRDAELDRDQALYTDTETKVRWHREAVLQWKDAEQLLAGLGSDVRAAPLAATMPELRRRLYADQAGPEWVDEIRSLVQPLRAARDRIQDPPPELGNIAETLAELRRWSDVLDGYAEAEIRQLQERHFKALNGETTEVSELEEHAQALRLRILDEASKVRNQQITAVEQDLADLRQAYGGVHSLQAAFEDLSRATSLTHPYEFREWQDGLERYHHTFLALAQAHIGDLDDRRRDTCAQIEAKLEAIEKRSISIAVGDDILRHRRQLQALPAVFEVEPILRQLRVLHAISREVNKLDLRADEELCIVEQRKVELAATNESLQRQVRRLKGIRIAIDDLGAAIASLSDSTADLSLEERRRRADDLAMQLEVLEGRFVDGCRAHFRSRIDAVQRAGTILRKAGAEPVATPLPSMPADARAHQAAEAVLEAKRQHQIVIGRMRELRSALDLRRERMIGELEELDTDILVPGDRHDVRQLLTELRAGAWMATNVLMERVDQLASLLERCDLFVERLLRAQNDALARLAELKRSFRAFNEDQLYRYCPELAERVEALIYGVPAQPRHWNAVQHQLDVASELFGRVAPHARRRAAEELHHAADALRLRIRGGDDRTGELRGVLADLEACGDDMLPPVSLRLRVLSASQRRTGTEST